MIQNLGFIWREKTNGFFDGFRHGDTSSWEKTCCLVFFWGHDAVKKKRVERSLTPQVNGLPRLFSSKPREDFGQQHHLSHPIIQDGACSPESPTSWTSGMTVNAAAAQEFCAGKQARLMTSSRKKRVFSPTFVMQWSFPTMQENVALDHYSIIFVSLNL